MTVAAVITQLVTVEAALSGILQAHDETPEGLGALPAFINYPLRGEVIGGTPGQIKGIHTVRAEVHLTRANLPTAESLARPYIDSFPKAIWDDPTLGGTVDTVIRVGYEYGRLEFGDKIHLGVQFEIEFKLQEDTS